MLSLKLRCSKACSCVSTDTDDTFSEYCLHILRARDPHPYSRMTRVSDVFKMKHELTECTYGAIIISPL